ncbi:MAG TPA: hypothetical protein VEH27_20225 [Methylomirabilota bacterium]|nr:hypothetical protein [Methylomirabilota bacterium]
MLQTVKRCLTYTDAMRVQMFLGSRGVEAFIPDEITSQLAPAEFMHMAGIRVQTRTEDAQRAIDELKDFDA